MTRARKIIIDTDPGIDDALAIFLALASPEIEVVGLTTIFGNVAVDVSTRNALALLEIAGRPDTPVAEGAHDPLVGRYRGAVPHIHGIDGQGDFGMAGPAGKPVTESAAEFLVRTVASAPGEIAIAAIGPLTNLALALLLRPQMVREVAAVVVMGGNALVPGNASPAAEANILNDPEAADVVFGAGWPIVMVGLDVTHDVLLTDAMFERIAASSKPMSQHVAKVLPHYRAFYRRERLIEGVYLHDPSAIALLIEPELFRTEAWPLRVETESISRGKTWPWMGGTDEVPSAWTGRPPVDVCVEVDADRVLEIVVDRLC